uniref:Uncharacterized protein n=1 Tax=Mycena chlorophos TaxID=658473 RepID=A0ABQ0LVQ9_MYCCL|nr:predicted protein [Mycena chlorophos]
MGHPPPTDRRLGNVGTQCGKGSRPRLDMMKQSSTSQGGVLVLPRRLLPVGSLLLATYHSAPVTGLPHKTAPHSGPALPYTMAHPYSGAAGYIHASEYPYTPVKAQHPLQSANGDDVESEIDPYGVGVEQYRPIHSFNPSNTIWSAQDSDLDLVLSYTHNLTVLLKDGDDQDSILSPISRGTFGAINPPGPIPSRPLRPLPGVPSQIHPYAPPIEDSDDADVIRETATERDAWYDEDSVVPGPGAKLGEVMPAPVPISAVLAPARRVGGRGHGPSSNARHAIYEYSPSSRGVKEQRTVTELARMWRRKIRKRVRLALRRLRKLLNP